MKEERWSEVQLDATRVVHAWASTDVAARVFWAPSASRAIDRLGLTQLRAREPAAIQPPSVACPRTVMTSLVNTVRSSLYLTIFTCHEIQTKRDHTHRVLECD